MGGVLHHLRHRSRCYMVCAIARTGSNLLTDGLHATRRAGRPKQFFLEKFEPEYGAKHGLDASADFAGYVRGIVRETATSNEVFGFKVMGWYLASFVSRLRDAGFGGEREIDVLRSAFPRLRFVQILRGNKLRQAISKVRAVQSGLWKIQDGNRAVAEPHFDEDAITANLGEIERDERTWSEFFSRNEIRPLRIQYEELCSDFPGTIRAVLDFLKIKLPRDGKIPPPGTIRQTDSRSREWEERYLDRHPQSSPLVTNH